MVPPPTQQKQEHQQKHQNQHQNQQPTSPLPNPPQRQPLPFPLPPTRSPWPTRARRRQWISKDEPEWDVAEWDALVANFCAEIREYFRVWEEEDEREREREAGEWGRRKVVDDG
ncbi:hypothetical protein PMIN06_011161 [Paraphaeosphaeria minitans]|uniref:Uncharacterized protein n=1 Tax=Paraphaeosphaeria minitans TaxID=565426 RepID=A0A9P6G4W0_9PLEO|nr:hypothetical protein PMIN01_13272 [Paraphaeosphaeria minitans]